MNYVCPNSLTLIGKVVHRSKVMFMLTVLLSAAVITDAAVTNRIKAGDDSKNSSKISVEAKLMPVAVNATNSTASTIGILTNDTWKTSAYNKNATIDDENNNDDEPDGGESPDYNSTPTAALDMNGTEENDNNNGNEDDEENDDEQIYGENENYLDNYDDNDNGVDDENPELEEDDEGGI